MHKRDKLHFLTNATIPGKGGLAPSVMVDHYDALTDISEFADMVYLVRPARI